ncbi:MAG: IS1380 family transposase [Ilumatobacteraceae bacterium]
MSFDEPNLVTNAGLLLTATLSHRLGLEALIDDTIKLGGRVGGARPGRKVLTLVDAMIAGATHIDHADMLRAGSTAGVLGHRVMAPSTLGTFLRSFTFGHLRQLEAINGRALQRAWAAGVGPGGALVIDIDSTICEVIGKHKQDAGYGYTRKLGYHPILATRADTGEVLHARMRKGSANTQRGARRFIDELVARVRRAGVTNTLTIRFDSGFWANDTILALNPLDVRYTMAVRCSSKGINDAISRIPDDAWTGIEYTDDGEAEVAECEYTIGAGKNKVTRRLVVRRTRLTDKHQLKLWPDWRHFGFLTDLDGTAVDIDKFTGNTPWSNSRSATSKKALDSSTSRPATSTPTAPGCNAPSWPTT